MTSYSPLTHTRTAEHLIASLTDSHHRAILKNYRRHALLEVAGPWEEILTPDMTVDHPVYRLSAGGVMTVLDGRDAVAGFYRGMADARRNVFGPVEQRIAVADWGFAAEATFQAWHTGRDLVAQGERLDPDKTYRAEWRVASAWHYTPDARLIGEHIYEGFGGRTYTECDPSEVITPEQAATMLEPVLAKALETT